MPKIKTNQTTKSSCDLSGARQERGTGKEVFLLIPMSAAALVMSKECKSSTGEIFTLPLGVPKYLPFCHGIYMKNMSDASEAVRIEAQKAS